MDRKSGSLRIRREEVRCQCTSNVFWLGPGHRNGERRRGRDKSQRGGNCKSIAVRTSRTRPSRLNPRPRHPKEPSPTPRTAYPVSVLGARGSCAQPGVQTGGPTKRGRGERAGNEGWWRWSVLGRREGRGGGGWRGGRGGYGGGV